MLCRAALSRAVTWGAFQFSAPSYGLPIKPARFRFGSSTGRAVGVIPPPTMAVRLGPIAYALF